jgi:hypothetical protein
MNDKFTKPSFLKASQEALDFQLLSLYPIRAKHDRDRVSLIFLNHDRNLSTFLTIMYLVELERVADIYTLSRSMFESVVSMGLLAKALIPNDLDRYMGYQFVEIQKTHSHLQRLGLAHLSGVSPPDVSHLRGRHLEYVKKYGNKLQTWTGESLEQNTRLIDSSYPATCNEEHFYEYLYCQVYRWGSSSTHSSFAGLSKGVEIERVTLPGLPSACRFKGNEPHLIFSCFHSLLVFLSSVRFMGHLLHKEDTEQYFHKIAKYVISE